MKKKMISLFLCGMMAVTAIVGCGGSGETKSEESGSEVVEIEFWYGLGGKLGETMESIINDFNAELINLYTVIKENPLELIADLKKHKNEADYFYEIRSLDRDREKF